MLAVAVVVALEGLAVASGYAVAFEGTEVVSEVAALGAESVVELEVAFDIAFEFAFEAALGIV